MLVGAKTDHRHWLYDHKQCSCKELVLNHGRYNCLLARLFQQWLWHNSQCQCSTNNLIIYQQRGKKARNCCFPCSNERRRNFKLSLYCFINHRHFLLVASLWIQSRESGGYGLRLRWFCPGQVSKQLRVHSWCPGRKLGRTLWYIHVWEPLYAAFCSLPLVNIAFAVIFLYYRYRNDATHSFQYSNFRHFWLFKVIWVWLLICRFSSYYCTWRKFSNPECSMVHYQLNDHDDSYWQADYC